MWLFLGETSQWCLWHLLLDNSIKHFLSNFILACIGLITVTSHGAHIEYDILQTKWGQQICILYLGIFPCDICLANYMNIANFVIDLCFQGIKIKLSLIQNLKECIWETRVPQRGFHISTLIDTCGQHPSKKKDFS